MSKHLHCSPWAACVIAAHVFALCPQARAQQPPAYKIDTASSRAYIKVGSATRIGHEHGVEGTLASGTLSLGGTGKLVFDMRNFTADTDRARQYVGLERHRSDSDAAKVTANMRGPDVLDVAHFPTATLAVQSMTPDDGQAAGQPGAYQMVGQFTLHGVTQGVRIHARLDRTARAGVLHLVGALSIRQTKYGIQPFSALGGLAKVADGLMIWGDLILTPAE